jgi:hypothetical protein
MERGKADADIAAGPERAGGERERVEQQELRDVEYRRGIRWRTGS